jgi:hypothetical protein
MPTIKSRLEFLRDGEPVRDFHETVEIANPATEEGEENLAIELDVELRMAIAYSSHLDLLPQVTGLFDAANREVNIFEAQDVYNTDALWLEIENTFRDVRFLLAQSKAYKDLKPPGTIRTMDRRSFQRLYYAHREKMYRFDFAVIRLIKIQDLVLRLLHENSGGALVEVNYDDDSWEEALRFRTVKAALRQRAKNGLLAQSKCNAIISALESPSSSSRELIIRYRNRMKHGLRPSVDYPEFFPQVDQRKGQPILDQSRKEKGRGFSLISVQKDPEFTFEKLYSEAVRYMDAVVVMLNDLKVILVVT